MHTMCCAGTSNWFTQRYTAEANVSAGVGDVLTGRSRPTTQYSSVSCECSVCKRQPSRSDLSARHSVFFSANNTGSKHSSSETRRPTEISTCRPPSAPPPPRLVGVEKGDGSILPIDCIQERDIVCRSPPTHTHTGEKQEGNKAIEQTIMINNQTTQAI